MGDEWAQRLMLMATNSPGTWDLSPNDQQAIATCLARLAEAERERDEAREWVRRMHREQQTLTCVYCGRAYPPGTPASNDDALTEHIGVCEKHPMAEMRRELECAKRVVGQLLASAVPHPVEHPTMTAAWQVGKNWLARVDEIANVR